MKSNALVSFILGITLIGINSASALDIPLLTWEKGKAQSVVLGGPTANRNWDVVLLSSDRLTKISFKSSQSNKMGFKVYTVNLPKNLKEGSYSIETGFKGSKYNVVAQVVIVPAKIYEIVRAPSDLLKILLILAFLIHSSTSLRRKSFSNLYFHDLFESPQSAIGIVHDSRLGNSYFSSMRLQRANILNILPNSFLKILLRADSSVLFTFFPFLAILLPSLAISGSLLVSLMNTQGEGNYSYLSVVIAILLMGIGILDIFSGFCSAFVFLIVSILFESKFGVDSLVVNLFIAGAFVIPGLFILIGEFKSKVALSKLSKVHWWTAALGYLSLLVLILKSLNIVVSADYALLGMGICLFVTTVILKSRFLVKFLNEEKVSTSETTAHRISRVVSPSAAIGAFILLLALFMNWTMDFVSSLLSAFLWSSPFFLTFIKFKSRKLRLSRLISVNTYWELLIVFVLISVIFQYLQIFPWLVEDRSTIILIATAFPIFAHSLFVTFVESQHLGEARDL